MLVNNQPPAGEYRHNYIRLAFLIGALLLFIGYGTLYEIFERGSNSRFVNGTIRTEDLLLNDVGPSDWVYRCLNAINYFWQFAWLLYALTFVTRRSSTGYLYLSPDTLTPTFYVIYILSFVLPAVWLVFLQAKYIICTWIVYLISFLLQSLALFIVNNNLAVNEKIYETEGLVRDIWYLRCFAQNGVAFFACWTGVRCVLALDTFLQVQLGLSMTNAGTIVLFLAAIIAAAFFILPNFNAALVEKCAYHFAPWIVFIIFFWGVVENNWLPKNVRRNNIIAAIELAASVLAAIGAMALFTLRYQTLHVDPIV